jgi:hypothetical protein
VGMGMEYDDYQGEISREEVGSNDPKVHAMRPDCPHCHPPFPTCCSPSRDILFWETRLHLSDILNERRGASRARIVLRSRKRGPKLVRSWDPSISLGRQGEASSVDR